MCSVPIIYSIAGLYLHRRHRQKERRDASRMPSYITAPAPAGSKTSKSSNGSSLKDQNHENNNGMTSDSNDLGHDMGDDDVPLRQKGEKKKDFSWKRKNQDEAFDV
eukprot:gb/GECH01014771.1/.p1 GENE.gb/GECH01014771.1/~~gb/GECH01014771.1/.p1  ORF type:complete len:106 (+),score=37.23 gb/GECH01014771.1/:1-318(+)